MGLFDFYKNKKKGNKKQKVNYKENYTEAKNAIKKVTKLDQPAAKYTKSFDKDVVDKLVDDINYIDNYYYYNHNQCPACKRQIVEEVKDKIKCPYCDNTIIVRTHYSSKKKMLLLEKQIEKYERECKRYDDLKWAINKAVTIFGVETSIRTMLNAAKAATKFDILLQLINKKTTEHMKNFQWVSYRNTHLDIAKFLEKEGNKEKALVYYLKVSFFDLNGPRNAKMKNGEPITDYDLFEPKDSLPLGIINAVKRLTNELSIDKNRLKALFLTSAEHVKKGFPLTPEQVWDKFYKVYKSG